jgi:hypothetical protein
MSIELNQTKLWRETINTHNQNEKDLFFALRERMVINSKLERECSDGYPE